MHEKIFVPLTDVEIALATFVGRKMHEKSLKDGRKDNHGLTGTPEERLQIHIQGAIAELALAKWLNIFWGGTLDVFKSVMDVGGVFEVRSIDSLKKKLIVRDDDPNDRNFVCIAVLPEGCYIMGHMLAKDCKKGKWYNDPNDRPPAYFVPTECLKDPNELKTLYSALSK